MRWQSYPTRNKKMKKILTLTILLSTVIFAQLNVATTYNYLGEVTKRIGGDLVKVDVLSSPKLDPHFITPKPSLIAKLRGEDLLIINGGGLEMAWILPLLRSANNGKIKSGGRGFLDVSGAVTLMDKPVTISRSMGDVHADGNPHFALSIENIVPIAELINMKLSQLDPTHQATYNKNFEQFKGKMEELSRQLKKEYASCQGKKVLQYHELFNYALDFYGVESVGNIEPLPGISPSSKHTLELINTMKEQKVTTILQDVYHEKKTANFIASKTGAELKVVPHDVGAVEGVDTLEEFYTTIGKALCQ